ncbi:uncharacterized protein LOC123662769 [Melitaea cinxia]|uniref:uncharacterized protein LOC123662769 n=1 Tax=Melitaea cinxia TaxID=113334 RepID=UPI001E271D9F|nr:uncharacterized protein LOC123662769 [Melitaea cinxia]
MAELKALVAASLARLESVFSEYNEYCIKILAVDINDSEDSSIIEDTYLDLVTKLNTLLNKSALRTATPCTSKIKLPNVVIPTFTDLPSMTKSTTSTLRNMISEVKQHLAALRNLDEPVDSWDSIIVCILSRKLDSFSSRAFQMDRDNKSRPTIKEFLSYLEKRALALDNFSTGSSFTQQKQQPQRLASHAVAANPASATCIYCPATTA